MAGTLQALAIIGLRPIRSCEILKDTTWFKDPDLSIKESQHLAFVAVYVLEDGGASFIVFSETKDTKPKSKRFVLFSRCKRDRTLTN